MASTKYLDYDGLLYFWTLIKGKLALKADAQSVTAGSYGPSANASPAHGGNFKVPYVQVTSQGVVTAISEKTITLPSDNNTDTLVTQNVSTANEEHPILLTVTKDAASNQGAKTSIFASGVKVNPSTNTVTATFSNTNSSEITINSVGLYHTVYFAKTLSNMATQSNKFLMAEIPLDTPLTVPANTGFTITVLWED